MSPKLFMTAAFLFCCVCGLAQTGQGIFMNDANGRPVLIRNEQNTEGSPYFADEYNIAEITSTAGKIYPNVKVKINISENEVLYLTDDGKEMAATIPIKRIRFINFVIGKGDTSNRLLESFGKAMNTPRTPVYEVLDSGRCSLLKLIRIGYLDNRKFNEASTTRTYQRSESFHLLLPDGTTAKLSPGKDEIVALLKDKEALVSAFIDEKRLKCRNAGDYKKVIAYYNSLFL